MKKTKEKQETGKGGNQEKNDDFLQEPVRLAVLIVTGMFPKKYFVISTTWRIVLTTRRIVLAKHFPVPT